MKWQSYKTVKVSLEVLRFPHFFFTVSKTYQRNIWNKARLLVIILDPTIYSWFLHFQDKMGETKSNKFVPPNGYRVQTFLSLSWTKQYIQAIPCQSGSVHHWHWINVYNAEETKTHKQLYKITYNKSPFYITKGFVHNDLVQKFSPQSANSTNIYM